MRVALCLLLVACSAQQKPTVTEKMIDAGALEPVDAAVAPVASTEPALEEPSFEAILRVLGVTASGCPSTMPADARIRCAFDDRYRGDPKAASLAHQLWVKWKIVAGVEVAHTMDGGYRGQIRIEPAVPINADRKHLEWVVAAMGDMEKTFDDLAKYGRDAGVPRYRWHPITVRFMRSVAARTPSAYANDWTIAWNLNGSLNTSEEAARETLVHEIFHLNDFARPVGDVDAWSKVNLAKEFDFAVKKCGTSIPCLGPYTPNDTIVRGGTYYSFQPGNGVVEYAAELALRYYREQRTVLRGEKAKQKSFKCGPPENLRAWNAMRDDWFGGIDAVPPCP